jgi:putative flavoprotein involved in K+ transport
MGSDPVSWLRAFESALARREVREAADLFADECYWRDLVAFTWNIKTCEGRAEIGRMLEAALPAVQPRKFVLKDRNGEAWFEFETSLGRGVGHLRLRDGKCWTLLTALRELKGFEEKAGVRREPGVEHGVFRDRKNWLESRKEIEDSFLSGKKQPYVLIVGGGQGGIALGARLKRLGVPALIVEKNARAGDSWRKRYRSLCLHDPVWYDHMPYLPFPDHWPVFTPKDKMGDWLEAYVMVMELDYWASAECLSAAYDEGRSQWRVRVRRGEKEIELSPKHLVLATGMSGFPNMPRLPGAEAFQGELCHSSAFRGEGDYREKKAVVLGSNNSAHDICAALWEQGAAEVTMLQRSPSVVIRSESLMEPAWGRLYSESALAAGITTDIADLTVASVPFKVLPSMQKPIYDEIKTRDADLYAGLDKAGFRYHFGEDGSGLHALYLRRGAGYYIDVGASQMLIDGRIRLEHAALERVNARSVTLDDGSELAADLVVCATGYGSMYEWAAKLISPEVADRVGPCWGLG